MTAALIPDPSVETSPDASSAAAYFPLLEQLALLTPSSGDRSELVEAAISIWSRPGFDTFASLAQLRFDPFDHQLRAATVVLQQMSGRAILADEVGLGKTIEAGIILSELRLRGLAGKVLVLAPTGLVGQWAEELERKFGIPTVVASRQGWPGAGEAAGTASRDAGAVVLASMATARRAPLSDLLAGQQWDLIVVDEAHRVRNPRTASAKLVRSLQARFMLLLTATPVENRIEDLYHLVSLVRPGHLGTIGDFRRRHASADSPLPGVGTRSHPAATRVAELPELRRSLRDVMIRHRRSEVALMLPRRLAETQPVMPSFEEAELYRHVSERVRVEGRLSGSARTLALRTVQRMAGSSPSAVVPTLDRMGWPDLAARARTVSWCSKSAALGALLERYAATGEKVIVFTSFRETLKHLVEFAAARGIPASEYNGSLGRRQKDGAVELFEHDVDVLLTTESAGEGRNLQFCHVMINFDLPWNPMQIEQRLGRIHRIGQTHDVELTNLVARGTIEERILEVLHSKLNLFELVIGELDMVLGRVGDDFDFEDAVFDAHVASHDDTELAGRLDALGEAMLQARADHAESRSRTDELVDELEGSAASLPSGSRWR
jgi:SNF2 family DNA or RNA helicase